MKNNNSKLIIIVIFMFLMTGCGAFSNKSIKGKEPATEEVSIVKSEIPSGDNSLEVSEEITDTNIINEASNLATSNKEKSYDYQFAGNNYITYDIVELFADLELTESEKLYTAVIEEEYRIVNDNSTFLYVKNAMNNKAYEGWVRAEKLIAMPTGISESKSPMNLIVNGIENIIGLNISEIEDIMGTNYNVSVSDYRIQIDYVEKGVVFLITFADRKVKEVIFTIPIETNLPVQIEDDFLKSVEILSNTYGISEHDGGENCPTRKFTLDNGYVLVITAEKNLDVGVTNDSRISVISILDFNYLE